ALRRSWWCPAGPSMCRGRWWWSSQSRGVILSPGAVPPDGPSQLDWSALEPLVASIDPAELARRLDSIVAKAGPAAPLLLFLASFLEYVFPPVPGDLVAVLGAWYATHGGLSWTVLFVSLSFGAVAGTAFEWRLGRWLGARVDARVAGGRLDRGRPGRFARASRRSARVRWFVDRFRARLR